MLAANIGTMHMSGIGISRNFVKAYMWFSIAGQGDSAAVSNKNFLLKRMTSEELSQAKTLAKGWLQIQKQNKKD